ncbi:PREDICTED: B3 domain-containing protein REM5-like isoform X2 [Ipomoea nil]|uniref:B3 domain-containing protein REM5-like isoform X2 n=1 Tax=Ipomoea nil TaxID=35883 RepID=UPI000901279F|nr:PREDICTED: B3 domain-containing protein REM5-like isoform X2 [Ipomoea nil]
MSNFNMQNENPSFFKILSASDFASVLRLPPLFGKIFGEKLSSTPSLAMAGSWKSWTVKLKKSSNRYLFADGENSSNLGQTMSVKKESETEDDKSQISIGPSKTTTNPSFVTILSASTDEEMIIPKGFVEETGIAGKRNITLLDARGEKWEIKISKQDGEFVMCGGRWADFRIANRLSKGYVCTFELVGSHGGHHQLQFHLEKRARGRPLGRHSRQ